MIAVLARGNRRVKRGVVGQRGRRLLELTDAEGRDPATPRLIIRANVVVTERPHGQPHVGPVRWIADELLAYAEIGAHEAHLDLQFIPEIRTAEHYLDTAETTMRFSQARLDQTHAVPA